MCGRAFCTIFDRGASTERHWAFRRASTAAAHPLYLLIPRNSGILMDKLLSVACMRYPPGTPPQIVQSREGLPPSVMQQPAWSQWAPRLYYLYAPDLTSPYLTLPFP